MEVSDQEKLLIGSTVCIRQRSALRAVQPISGGVMSSEQSSSYQAEQ